ncbi:hypothetical protein BGX30_000322 [Mortierella sp. GBA39]|nr:hypothetical protein BGX30_000322 [Mortierella sp. GBA39]
MKLVITGATGNLGGLVIDHLLKKIPGSQIIAVVRKLDKAASLTEAGLEVRQGDYNDPGTLRAAFEGGTKLLFVSSPDTDDSLRIVQHANVITAARDAGIRHIAYTSFAFAEENPFALVHMATEYAIRATRIPYTFLRNGGYAEFFINDHLQANVERGAIVTNTGTGRVNAVSRSDLALAAATVLTGEGHENKEYTLVSDRPWSFDELAEVLSEVSVKNASGNTVQHTAPFRFELGGEQVLPQYNVYSFKEQTAAIYTSELSGKDIILYFKYGATGKLGGTLAISVDGQKHQPTKRELLKRD